MSDEHRQYDVDELDYGFDWSSYLDAGDTIDSSDWSYKPETTTALTLYNGSSNTNSTIIWVKDGQPGQRYTIYNQVDTVGGRKKHRYFFLTVDEKE
jgi:hypothetical protein